VVQTVVEAVGVETGSKPIEDLLARPELLAGVLLLDNCEHVLDACAALGARLLADVPALCVLATSREPLGLVGERVWPVRPLEIPDYLPRNREQLARVESVQLLLDRAGAVRPDLEVGDNDVAPRVQICRALDGMPLAIELAAGRLRSLSFVDLAARLGDQLSVLTRSAGGTEARHQALRVTFDWSYDLLTEPQRWVAKRLSVFSGGFRLDAIESVCGADLDVLDSVDELVAKSLVTFDGATARYRLLEPLRQYLADRLEESGATETVRRAHAEWVAGLCDRLGTRLLEDKNQKARSRRLGEESGNIDLALRWAHHHDPAIATRIVSSLGHYWLHYDQASGRRWCDLVIKAATDVAPRSRANALLSAGMIAQNDQAWERSIAWLREALAIYRLAGDAGGQAAALYFLGIAVAKWWDPEHSEDDAVEATRCFEESARLFTQLGNWFGAGWCRNCLSRFPAIWNDDLDRAEQLANQVLQECSAAGARHPMGGALSMLAFIAHRRGRDDVALEFLHDAVALYRELDDSRTLTGWLVHLAAQEAAMDRGAEALQALAESSELDEEIGRLPGRSYRLAVAAVVHLARGQTSLAVSALGAYDAHPTGDASRARFGFGGYLGWLDEAVEKTRLRLGTAEVAAATATARHEGINELIDRLIIQPAKAAGASCSTLGSPGNR
jgi:predicted ATPase